MPELLRDPKSARARRAARLGTLAVFRHADAAYAPFSCPATSECCQLGKTGRQPWLWPNEWLLLEEELAKSPRTARADGGCPFLDENGKRCTVYAVRPFGCRTFFCHRVQGPSRQPAEATNALLLRLESVARELDPDCEPKPLMDWFRGRA